MYERWRCKRCETYNDGRDEKCVVCGFLHSDQIDDLSNPGWFGEDGKAAADDSVTVSGGASGSSGVKVTPPVKGKVSSFRIVLAVLSTIIVLAASGSLDGGGVLFGLLAIPLVFLWVWACSKKK